MSILAGWDGEAALRPGVALTWNGQGSPSPPGLTDPLVLTVSLADAEGLQGWDSVSIRSSESCSSWT